MSLIEEALRRVQDPVLTQEPAVSTIPPSATAAPAAPSVAPAGVHSPTPRHDLGSSKPSAQPESFPLPVSVAAGAMLIVALMLAAGFWIRHALQERDPSRVAPRQPLGAPQPSAPRAAAPQRSQPKTPKPLQKRSSGEALVVSGIVEGLGQSYAVINDKIVGVGESVEGSTLLTIANGAVTLRRPDGSELTLRVGR